MDNSDTPTRRHTPIRPEFVMVRKEPLGFSCVCARVCVQEGEEASINSFLPRKWVGILEKKRANRLRLDTRLGGQRVGRGVLTRFLGIRGRRVGACLLLWGN